MSIPYVCSACCRRSALHVSRAPVKKHVAYSSSNAIDSILVEDNPFPRPQRNQQPRYSRPSRQDGNGSREQPSLRRANESGTSDAADFTTILASSTGNSTGRYSRAQEQSATPGQEQTHTGNVSAPPRAFTSELEELLLKRRFPEAWLFFTENFQSRDSPALARPSIRDYAKVSSGVVYKQLLAALTTAWSRKARYPRSSLDFPSPLEVLDRFEEIGLASEESYAKCIWILSSELSIILATSDNVLPQDPVKEIVRQIMSMWGKCLTQQKDMQTVSDTKLPLSPLSFVDSEGLAQKPRKGLYKEFQAYFTVFVPAAQPAGLSDSFSASALLVYDSLTHGQLTGDDFRSDFEQYIPFTDSMTQLLQRFRLGDRLVNELKRRLIQHKMSAEAAESLCTRLRSHFQPKAYKAPASDLPPTETSAAGTLQRYVKSLGTAREKQDLDSTEKLWKNAAEVLKQQDLQSCDVDALVNVYEQFLLTFLALRRPQSALEVWNLMVYTGIEPTVRTWSVMMKGCHLSRDVHIMQSMWHRMRDSGIRPDVTAWSTRIYGLLRVGKIHDGLQALDEMGEEWTMAVRQHRAELSRGKKSKGKSQLDVHALDPSLPLDVPKPNVAILNSAITALGNRGAEHIPSILAWSRSFEIEPDVISYNALLSVSLGQGQGDEGLKVLQRMAAAGIEPDSATFTILLNNMFHSAFLKGLSHKEQENHIMDFVSSVESNGVQIDGKGYALLIDRLLKEYVNLPAVNTVLAHMAARNVQPSPHIYTILMTHYFDMSPPDLKSADMLWNQLQSRNNNYGAVLDTIFYDRMVEGYARHGDAGRTMAFLTRMGKEGKRPGWLAMAAAVRCLASQQDWDRVTQIVLDCHRQEGLLSAGLRGRKGQAEFWELVRGLGVLDNLGLDIAE